MRKRLWLVVAAVTLLGIVGGVLTLPSAASSPTPPIRPWAGKGWNLSPDSESIQSHEGGQTIRFRVVFGQTKCIDLDGRGPQPGDYCVFRDFLVRSGRRVGTNAVIATLQFPFTERVFTNQWEVSLKLPGRGEITAAGRVQFTEAGIRGRTLAITGGTGHFQNVRGELHLTEQPGIILHLLP